MIVTPALCISATLPHYLMTPENDDSEENVQKERRSRGDESIWVISGLFLIPCSNILSRIPESGQIMVP